jgi:hypothetical protein
LRDWGNSSVPDCDHITSQKEGLQAARQLRIPLSLNFAIGNKKGKGNLFQALLIEKRTVPSVFPLDVVSEPIGLRFPKTCTHVFALGLIAVSFSLAEAVEVAFRQLPLPV